MSVQKSASPSPSFKMAETLPLRPVLKVFGIGGGGSNAVKHMATQGVDGIEYYCVNTDIQHLGSLGIDESHCIQIGSTITRGLGAGTDPKKGYEAAVEDAEQLTQLISGANMLFITAGMGGGTGTGAAPVVAKLARELDILTVAIVTKPFNHENRMEVAEQGIHNLSEYVDAIITIPNNKLLSVLDRNTPLPEAFAKADDVLHCSVMGITDLIIRPGHIMNVDFADLASVMKSMGSAVIGTGIASGPDRAKEATEAAIRHPLVESMDFHSAQGLLLNISAGEDLTLIEYQEISNYVRERYTRQNAKVAIGTTIDPMLRDQIKITVVAAGIDQLPAETSLSAQSSDQIPGSSTKTVSVRPMELDFAPRMATEHMHVDSLSQTPGYLNVAAFINSLGK